MIERLILVVDDTHETRRLMRRVLERDGLRVIEAATGEDALGQIAAHRPDLVVLDLRLPGMSGVDVARAVRGHRDPLVAEVVLLACSASIQPEVVAEALAAGCDAFESKPFDVTLFGQRIRDLIEARYEPGRASA